MNYNPKEYAVFTFCQASKNAYISPQLTFKKFKSATAAILSFHINQLPPDALRTAIDKFASDLSDFLWALDYKEKPGAKPKVRDAIRTPDLLVQGMLDVVGANYQ